MLIKQTLDIKTLTLEKMTGSEKYNIAGRMLSREEADEIFKLFKGLMRRGNCLRKACIVRDWLNRDRENAFSVIIGSLYVIDSTNHSSYGHEYNPPLEYHAWVYGRRDKSVYDLALPGVIERGLEAEDDMGCFLTSLKPIILASGTSRIPHYLQYKAHLAYAGDGSEELKL
jgi:hypothetical protein